MVIECFKWLVMISLKVVIMLKRVVDFNFLTIWVTNVFITMIEDYFVAKEHLYLSKMMIVRF